MLNENIGKDEMTTFTFLSQDDPYDSTKDEILRNKWIEEAKMLYGEFKPSGKNKPIEQITKSWLMEMVDIIKKMLLNDWNDVNFVIGSKKFKKIIIYTIANPQDMIEIKFDLSSLDSLQGLHAYMTTLINSNSEILRYCLRKV